MTTQATAANPIQVSLVLDGGMFLKEVKVGKYDDAQIGYFSPSFMIYGDWNSITAPELSNAPAGYRNIDVRHVDATGREKTNDVNFSKDLVDRLLRREKIYTVGSPDPPVIETRFDWIFNFNSGYFRCSSVKDRYFKEMNAQNQPTSKRVLVKDMAHDVVIHYDLAPGERLEIAVGPKVLWKSTDYPAIAKRFDIEVIAPHSSAEHYFRDALDHKGRDYWLPNQGDPGPVGGRP